jgi:predicted metal-binding protein
MISESLHEQIIALAGDAGATHSRIVVTDRVKIHQSVRDSCAANYCGKYGSCWTCPPRVGELAELEARIRSFPQGLLIQNVAALEDSWDFDGMTRAAHDHNDMIRSLGQRLTETFEGIEVLPLGAGGCGYCEKCSCPDSPCVAPDQALGSIEGYGTDVKALVESCGLRYINGQNTVSYVGVVFFRM